MAVTKTHPIKSTLKAAIDYICNPEKTDGKLLVSAYGCSVETADIEFAWTRRHAIDKGTNLGRHLIQAFQPGEVTPEQAHEIGMELAKEILGGKYEFVLTTHIDKDHVHNHLIFNAVSFQDHKHYHSNKRSYHFIRRTSDRLCKEHGLSVIIPGQDKGKSYIEHQTTQNGTSYKAKLKAAIDRLLPACSSLEELLRRLQREGYEIKRGKYISARAPDQERFTRLKTLGVDYTEEALAARIVGRSRPSRQPKQRSGKISLLIDIQNNIKAQQRTDAPVRQRCFQITHDAGNVDPSIGDDDACALIDHALRHVKHRHDDIPGVRDDQHRTEGLEYPLPEKPGVKIVEIIFLDDQLDQFIAHDEGEDDACDGNNDRFGQAADHVEDTAVPAGGRHADLACDLGHLRIHGIKGPGKV